MLDFEDINIYSLLDYILDLVNNSLHISAMLNYKFHPWHILTHTFWLFSCKLSLRHMELRTNSL